jgi:DNA-binding transcriptional ArsR family regulator
MAALDALSLHQLRVLLTLLEERSVSGAARRLGVSQPAVSHALRGLRDALDDAILVPGGRCMVPTPRALALVGPLRRALRELELLLGSSAAFDPATARRTFVIASWDGLALALLPRVLDSFRDNAPCVDLDVPVQLQVGQSLVYDLARPLRSVGKPLSLDAVACDFPELKLIGIHVGIPWTEEMIAMSWKHPNVYIGCDAHSPRYWPASFVHYINSYGQDKVIFGTDYPVLDFQRTRDEIEALGLKDGVLAKLLRENARRLYRLP